MDLTRNKWPEGSLEGKMAECVRMVDHYYSIAESVYKKTFPRPKILFNVRSASAAGKASHTRNEIRFNKEFIFEQDFTRRTIPHEVAHLIAFHVYKSWGHDWKWKHVMHRLGAVDSTTCHNYHDTVNRIKLEKGGKIWKCPCSDHIVSKRKHINMLKTKEKGGYYTCTKCKGRLEYKPLSCT